MRADKNDATLECQDCGEVVRILSPAEAQRVAVNPYNFVVLCADCQQVNDRIERLHDYGS